MVDIILAGNGVTAEILLSYLSQDSRYNVVGIVADDKFVASEKIIGIPCISFSKLNQIFDPKSVSVIMAMGYDDLNRSRDSMFKRIKKKGFSIETYVHPDSKVYTNLSLGEGSVILPGAILEPYTSLGENTMVWCNVTIAHHAKVGDHCWLASGCVVSGQAVINNNSFLGVNSTVVNAVEVGERNIVGANALITKCTQENKVYLARSGEEFRFSSEEYIKFFGV